MNEPVESQYPLDGLQAIIVEHSDDGGASWEISGIHWTVEAAVKEAQEIPWGWRLRYVLLTDTKMLVPRERIKTAIKVVEILEETFPSKP